MHSSAPLVVALLMTVGAWQAHARPLHYGAVTDAPLARCDQRQWRGEQVETCYRELLNGNGAPAMRAEAAWALGDLHEANRLFQSATRETPDNARALARWGDLYATTHDGAEAMALYRDALEADSQDAFALLGAARVLVGGFDEAANEYLEPLLTNENFDDGAKYGAWLIVARIALENHDLEEAEHNLGKAEALLEQNDWPPLELYALRAAAALIANEDAAQWTERALAYNPGWGDIHAVPAYFYVISRRYRQAIDAYQRAVDTEPTLASAHEALGVNLLRDNQFERARRHLELAHEHDPFSPVAVNTLRLLDSLDKFSVTEHTETADDGDVPLVLRLRRDEAPAITPYAIELVRDSIREFTERYRFELAEPVVIEMYPDHEDFAVRTAGMPGIGILGATFGYVVAMDSPSARSTDHFQWGTTLWHEMAHVFTLEASHHLVPRWFSEGVSVYEEWRSGPTPGVRIPMSVYAAMREDKFLPIADLDEGFIRPTYPDQVIVSYMQAGLICQFVDQTYGADKLANMLSKFADGMDTAAAIRAALTVSPAQLDREFAAFIEREHGALLTALEDWHKAFARLSALHADEDWPAVLIAAAELIDMHPAYVEADSPYLLAAEAHEALGRRDAARAVLQEYRNRGGFDPDALKQLAAWLAESGDIAAAAETLKTAALVQPLDEELHATRGRLLLDSNDAAGALQAFEILLALDPHDKATAHLNLAETHRALGNVEESRKQVLAALDIAPGFRPAQRLLLELARGGAK